MITEPRFIICPDTNILVEFRPLAELPWHELAPNAVHIEIVIPATVAEEMDGHKKAPGRLRRRSMEFNDLSRRIEEHGEEALVLRPDAPKVTVSIGNVYRQKDLDGEVYDLDDKDGRIVAEVSKLDQGAIPVILFSDDTKPLRLARQTELRCQRPPTSWRREEPKDDRDKEIETLNRQLGAHPILSIAFRDTDASRPAYASETSGPLDEAYEVGFTTAILSAVPKVSQDALITKYGIEGSGGAIDVGFSKLTRTQLSEYDRDYRNFEQRVKRVMQTLPNGLNKSIVVHFDVENKGTAAASGVDVVAEVKGDFKLALVGQMRDQIERFLVPPDPPVPALNAIQNSRFGSLLEQTEEIEQRVDWFYPHDEVDGDDDDEITSWRCDEFRHKAKHTLEVLIQPTAKDAKGVLHITMTGATLADPIQASALLRCDDDLVEVPASKFIANRFMIIPGDLQLQLRKHLSGNKKKGA